MRKTSLRSGTRLVLALALVAALGGCGRKLPPSPPETVLPAAVRDLTAGTLDGHATLAWTHVAPREKHAAAAAGYKVLRARMAAPDAGCSGCPVTFKVVGDLNAQTRTPGARLQFQEAIEPGYKYRYKIVAYSASGVNSGESNVVEAGE